LGWARGSFGYDFLVVYDTDIHGGVSGLLAVKSLVSSGFKVAHYSNFAQQAPATLPQWLPDTLPMLVQKHAPAGILTLDIPVDSRNPARFVDALSRYVDMGIRVLYVDHHDATQHHAALFKRGASVVLFPSSNLMSMYIPTILNAVNSEVKKFALIAATADYDEFVADEVSPQLEEDVEQLDVAWKGKLRELEPVKRLAPEYGNVGALVQYMIDVNASPEDLLMMGREYGKPVPDVKYEIVGDVVVGTEPAPQGLGWKVASKLARVAQAPVAVVIVPTPQQKHAVLVAAYWRAKSRYTAIVEQAVNETAAGRPVIGHPGARSIEAADLDDANKLASRVVKKLNELISTAPTKQKTGRAHHREGPYREEGERSRRIALSTEA